MVKSFYILFTILFTIIILYIINQQIKFYELFDNKKNNKNNNKNKKDEYNENNNKNKKDEYNKNNKKDDLKVHITGKLELHNNPNNIGEAGLNIQSGVNTDMINNGTITFEKPFSKVPKVFIQPNNSNSSKASIINISNISVNGFSYAKNQVYEEETGSFSSSVVEPDKSSSFNWIAFE